MGEAASQFGAQLGRLDHGVDDELGGEVQDVDVGGVLGAQLLGPSGALVLVVDAVIEPDALREELILRFAHAAAKQRSWPAKHNPVTPV